MDLNPAGETPVMVDSEAGIVLIGSQPIVEYLDETVEKMPMIHGNAVLRAEIRRLVEWFDEQLYREVVLKEKKQEGFVSLDNLLATAPKKNGNGNGAVQPAESREEVGSFGD